MATIPPGATMTPATHSRPAAAGPVLALLLADALCGSAPAHGAAADSAPPEEIVVTSQRREQPALDHAGNVARLDQGDLDAVRHQHLHELLTRVAGVWLSRGSGQEHLTAIRSPVLTGAGSCGAFLALEDGIPIRPAGFCNVNQFFEVDTEQARAIEIIRGPGNALYGSNALHGIVNVVMPMPGEAVNEHLGVEAGSNDFYRLRAQLPATSETRFRASLVAADDGGFRDDAGYRQIKGHLKATGTLLGGDLTAALSFTDLDQETAGFIEGFEAYRQDGIRTGNLNPEAFRKASSQRLYALWRRGYRDFELDVRPFLRHSDMRFLQHFLPGQPLEENGHVSAGVLASMNFTTETRSLIAGVDVEWSDVYLKETQDGPTEGSDFLRETRPAGKHYDYEVASLAIAPFLQAEFGFGERLSLSAGLRGEFIRYDYDNRMLDGNTRDDGSACGFGGCLYTRPADRDDDFTNFAPKLAARYRLSERMTVYASAGRGFRPPQMTELYRLQSGQQVADLDSERIDSVEFGLRSRYGSLGIDTSVFAMRKRDSVFRDADGFNVSGAKSRHDGIELSVDWLLDDGWRLKLDTSYAKHVYDFDRVAARGETFVSGRDVDTAPRWLGNAELFFEPNDRVAASLQWAVIGPYYLDAENRFEYRGHGLLNARFRLALTRGLTLGLRANNLADNEIADRADYAFGEYRYFPGRGREFFVDLSWLAGA